MANRPIDKNRLAHLDALRGWAILLVMICHVGGLVGGQMNLVTGEGNKGVELFYVLSAFMLFWTHYNKHAGERTEVVNFFIRRFFRIAPLFYPVVLMWTAILWSDRAPDAPSLAHIAATMLFVNGWKPQWINSLHIGEWSVAVEMTFYLIVPLLVRYVTNVNRALLFTALSMLASDFASRWADLHTPPGYEWYSAFWFPAHLPAFAIGITAFFFSRMEIRREYGPTIVGSGLFILLCSYNGDQLWVIRHHLMFAIGFALLTVGLGVSRYRVLVNTATVQLGKISFSAYLLHLGIMRTVYAWVHAHTALSGWPLYSAVLAASIAIVVPVSALTYRLIELPGIRLGSAIIKRRESRAASPVKEYAR